MMLYSMPITSEVKEHVVHKDWVIDDVIQLGA